jgi:hypothetical protein
MNIFSAIAGWRIFSFVCVRSAMQCSTDGGVSAQNYPGLRRVRLLIGASRRVMHVPPMSAPRYAEFAAKLFLSGLGLGCSSAHPEKSCTYRR